jgi:ribosomal protein S18 acetylase RimI-like enzyme
MYYTIVFENLTFNQRSCLINLIKENFPQIHYNSYGLDSKTIVILNYENEKIIGCVCLLNNRILYDYITESKENYNFGEKGLFIYNLCVNEKYRNKKIGSKLITITLELAKKINIDFLHTHAVTDISKNLFLKLGFMEEKKINGNICLMTKFV